jgi:hypothetical protein
VFFYIGQSNSSSCTLFFSNGKVKLAVYFFLAHAEEILWHVLFLHGKKVIFEKKCNLTCQIFATTNRIIIIKSQNLSCVFLGTWQSHSFLCAFLWHMAK